MECSECGKLILSKHGKLTCSGPCSRSRIRRMARLKQGLAPQSRVCVECGVCFETFKFRQITCSKDCRKSYTRKKSAFYQDVFWSKKINGPEDMGHLSLRFEILKRDKFKCVYCGNGILDGRKLHIDHIRPKNLGGDNSPSNLVTACQQCNLGKSDTPLKDVLI